MSIDFTPERWDHIREMYTAWWAGELKRPLLHLTVHGRDPGRPEPRLPSYGFTARYGLDTNPSDIVDVWDYELSRSRYLGDGFPSIWPNFGAGVAAAFLGARLEAREETVWFHPQGDREPSELHLTVQEGNPWLSRVKSICGAALERWEGLVQVGMTDLGGNLDIVSSFRPGEKLLIDLCTQPDEVKRLTWEAHEQWWRFYEEINAVLQPVNPGYTAWTPIYSADPYYMLQCDFCYMIGPDMFDEFVKPELAASCTRLSNPFYHLDGPGQLPHLDSLLSIDELKGVQWVPGDGNARWDAWPDVYRRIRDAGKRIQVWGPMEAVDKLIGELGSGEGIIAIIGVEREQEREAEEFLMKHGAA
ncbi:MAG: hypothetical protein GF331_23000 [Chitinivibrionales bacterium]|nr:hypothetical protein [Chitinivibrionales bacterium]